MVEVRVGGRGAKRDARADRRGHRRGARRRRRAHLVLVWLLIWRLGRVSPWVYVVQRPLSAEVLKPATHVRGARAQTKKSEKRKEMMNGIGRAIGIA